MISSWNKYEDYNGQERLGKRMEVILNTIKVRERLIKKVTKNGARNAFRCKRGIGVDDRQPVLTLQDDLCFLITVVIWINDEKENQPVEV